jgi:uncharacterized protein YbjT (DUF2867 family)
MTKTALLLGATGLTGSFLLQELLQNNNYSTIHVYVRTKLNIQHEKLQQHIINFDELETAVQATDVFCCLGTTIKKAGSKKAFEKVDYQYPLKIATLQYKAGSKNFFIISAMGANATSIFFYNRTKGKIEEALKKVGFNTLGIFRPSLIAGNRKEKRLAESLFNKLMKYINPLLPKNIQSVTASAIAKCMIYYANSTLHGNYTVQNKAIKQFE